MIQLSQRDKTWQDKSKEMKQNEEIDENEIQLKN